MCKAVISGLVCSFPWWKGYKAGFLSLQTLKHTQCIHRHLLHKKQTYSIRKKKKKKETFSLMVTDFWTPHLIVSTAVPDTLFWLYIHCPLVAVCGWSAKTSSVSFGSLRMHARVIGGWLTFLILIDALLKGKLP